MLNRILKLILMIALAAVFLLVFAPQTAQAATFNIGCTNGVGDVPALIQAINDANANPDADTIQLAADCVYMLADVYEGNTGLPQVTTPIVINGNQATITRDDPESLTDGFRLFFVATAGELTLNNITLRDGYLHKVFTNDGGAALLNYGVVNINGSTFSGHESLWQGGAIRNLGGTINIDRSTFSNNEVLEMGGAVIYNNNFYDQFPIIGTVNISNSLFWGNSANEGASVFENFANAVINIDNSTIFQNIGSDTDQFNAAINNAGIMSILSSSIYRNETSYEEAGAVGTSGIHNSGTMTIANSIIALNEGNDLHGTITSDGYNLFYQIDGEIVGNTSTNLIGVDPALDDYVEDNGGDTLTVALLSNSPAIDAGYCDPTTDQRGEPRTDLPGISNTPGGNGCDIGAYEAQTVSPRAGDDNYSTPFQTVLHVSAPGILVNDLEANNGLLTVVPGAGPSTQNGTLQLEEDGSFIYTPDAGFSGQDTFTYTALNNDSLNSLPATVTITVANGVPLAVDDEYSVLHSSPLSINSTNGVVKNDSDPNGDFPLNAHLISDVAHGTLTLRTNGSFLYIPQLNWTGEDTFTYTISDWMDNSNIATVTIHVTNQIAAAVNDSYTVEAGKTTTIAVQNGVLTNDSDPDGEPITASGASNVPYGDISLNSNGSFTYTPAAGFKGVEIFTYNAYDGADFSNTATVTITVTNEAPVAVNDAYTVAKGSTLTLNAQNGMLKNDVDENSHVLTVETLTDPAHGALVLNDNGSFTYTPNVGFSGTDTFTYKVSDGIDDSNTATVTITVGNTVPVATEDHYGVLKNQSLTAAVPGVLTNDTDANGDTLTAALVSNVSNGSLTFNVNGSFTYTPNADFEGTDNFTYKVDDGETDSNVVTVTITVRANTAPVANDDFYNTLSIDEYLSGETVLSNDIDADGDPLMVELVEAPSIGNLEFRYEDHANYSRLVVGAFTYTYTPGFVGDVTFTYKVNDGFEYSNPATVTISITEQPIRPAATNLHTTGPAIKPTFHWTHDNPGGNLVPDDWYQIVVVGEGVPINQWEFFLNICDGFDCAYTSEVELGEGTYTWYVNSYNDDFGSITQSQSATLIVDLDGIPSPAVITKIAPARNAQITTGLVQLSWLADEYATWYRLIVFNPQGFTFEQWYEGVKICVDNVCSVKRALPSGDFEWYLMAWGPGGMGSWGNLESAGSPFSIGVGVPGIPQVIYPANGAGLTVTDGIRPTWQFDPNAAWYRVYISGVDGFVYDEWHEALDICTETVCTLPEPLYLNSAVYTWYMVGWNFEGFGDWNSGSIFTINTPAPGVIQRLAPQGDALTATYAFEWQADPNAGWYQIYVAGEEGYFFNQWIKSSEVCDDNLCRFYDAPLTNGSYTWWIAAWSPGGMGEWSLPGMEFTLNVPTPEQISQTTPAMGGTAAAGEVVLQWAASENASWHGVTLSQSGESLYEVWLPVQDNCAANTCLLTVSLPAGIYKWTLQGWGPGGLSPETVVQFSVTE